MRRLFLIICWIISLVIILMCNRYRLGSLSGNLYDYKNNNPIVGASVILFKDGRMIKKNITDFDGKFRFDSIPDGSYNLKILYVGYNQIEISDITIKSGNNTKVLLKFNNEAIDTKDVKVEWDGGYILFIDSTGDFKCIEMKKQ